MATSVNYVFQPFAVPFAVKRSKVQAHGKERNGEVTNFKSSRIARIFGSMSACKDTLDHGLMYERLTNSLAKRTHEQILPSVETMDSFAHSTVTHSLPPLTLSHHDIKEDAGLAARKIAAWFSQSTDRMASGAHLQNSCCMLARPKCSSLSDHCRSCRDYRTRPFADKFFSKLLASLWCVFEVLQYLLSLVICVYQNRLSTPPSYDPPVTVELRFRAPVCPCFPA